MKITNCMFSSHRAEGFDFPMSSEELKVGEEEGEEEGVEMREKHFQG